MKYQFHNHFKKAYLKLPEKIKKSVNSKLMFFSKDSSESSLNNHPLSGKYRGYRSINITGDYRAIYREIKEDEVIFVKLGTHSELYR
jgi:addiction module RelE/StbE family toxin